MNKNNNDVLTDEELENVVGGATCYYEKGYDDEMGDYYLVTTPDGEVRVPANDWADWVNKLTDQGHTIESRG